MCVVAHWAFLFLSIRKKKKNANDGSATLEYSLPFWNDELCGLETHRLHVIDTVVSSSTRYTGDSLPAAHYGLACREARISAFSRYKWSL